MAQKVAAATGAWSAAATWNSVTNTPTLHASTNITISTSNLFTATFTSPGATVSATGALIFIPAVGSGGTVSVTLQDTTVDTTATASIATTSLVANTWVYFRFGTPYLMVNLAAGAFRLRIVNALAAGTTSAAADSGAANIAYLATDDRTGVPGTTDDIWICGQNQASAITVAMDGTQTIGSKTDTVVAVQRTLGNAISINNLGVLAWDTTADATLTCGGNIICNNNSGELQMGTVATPMPAARVATLRFDMAATGNHGLSVFTTGKLILQGTPKSSTTLWKAKLSSGVGTAASPAIINAAVDWSVGDEVMIGSTDTYDHNETRFIITKNSATSYVWSATSGGAEAALTYTHTTDAWVINVQRNVFIDSTNSARAFYVNVSTTTAGNVNVDWTRFDVIGSNNTNKTSFFLMVSNVTAAVDYSVFSRHYGALYIANTKVALSFTGNISIAQTGSTSAFLIQGASHNKTFTDNFVFNAKRASFALQNTYNATYTRCIAIGGNQDNSAGAPGGWSFSTPGKVVGVDCEVHCSRVQGVLLAGVSDLNFTGFLSGTKGTNAIDLSISTDTYNTCVFINSSFGSASFVSNYLTLLAGSEIAFQAYNSSSNNHTWYTNTGIARSTGAGLVDTTNKTAGNLTVRLAPEDSTIGFVWEFLIGIKASTAASIFGFAQKNVAFGTDVCTVELFLPNSTTADATATLDNTTGAWQVFTLAANYTGLVAGFATIRITAKTATASAYVYFTDFYNGTNVLTGLQAWYQGKPSPVFTDLLGDPASVWAILTSTLTTPGTIGYQLTNDLDDIQVRLPAALVGGRMDSSVGAMATDVITAAALSSGAATEIVTAIFAGLMEGLTFEEIIKEIWAQVAGDAVANDATNPTQIDYDGPDGAIELTHTRTATTRTRV